MTEETISFSTSHQTFMVLPAVSGMSTIRLRLKKRLILRRKQITSMSLITRLQVLVARR